jgi:glycosyltransferase involved in cell wall biosynthesis
VRPRNALALVELRRLIRRVDPHVLHAHSSIGGVLGRLAAVTTGRPRLYTPNGLATGRAPLLVERAMGRITDRFVAVSESEAAVARRHHIVPDDRLVVIPNGLDVQLPAPGPDLRAMLAIPAGAPIVGSIGRLVDQKAPERFLAVAGGVLAAEPDAHAVLIGDGPLAAPLAGELAALARTGRFHHLAQFPDAAGVVGQFDVFVLLSRFEGGPYAPLEAMRAAVPVVLSDVVGNRDVVVDGASGHLVAEDDAEGAVQVVRSLLADPQRAREVGDAGRLRMVTTFDVATMGSCLAGVYRQVSNS